LYDPVGGTWQTILLTAGVPFEENVMVWTGRQLVAWADADPSTNAGAILTLPR
jgi:hypothetical protein